MRIALAGPTSAGKTVYLASLMRAYEFNPNRTYEIHAIPAPDNRPAQELYEVATRLICGDLPMATASVTAHELQINLPRSFVGRTVTSLPLLRNIRALTKPELVSLTFVDVPGGGCMPEPGRETAAAVVADLAQADAMLLLLSGQGLRDGSMSDAGSRLRTLLDQVRDHRQERGLPLSRHVFERLCVTVSMADVLVAEDGREALRKLEWMDPYHTVKRHMGDGFIREVRRAVAPGGDGYALVSAFGFERSSGNVAAQQDVDGWNLGLDEGTFGQWWPYRLFEPVEFLARGIHWRARIQ